MEHLPEFDLSNYETLARFLKLLRDGQETGIIVVKDRSTIPQISMVVNSIDFKGRVDIASLEVFLASPYSYRNIVLGFDKDTINELMSHYNILVRNFVKDFIVKMT